MMNKKWLVRAGSLLVMLGFVLPSLTVSCAINPGIGQSFSLADIANQAKLPLLYFVPLGVLAVFIFTFMQPDNRLKASYLFWGQVGGALVGVLCIAISLLSISNEANQYGFKVSPEFGLFLLVSGYVLVTVGLVHQSGEISPSARSLATRVGSDPYSSNLDVSIPVSFEQWESADKPVKLDFPKASLELINGNLAQSMIHVTKEKFSIGRKSDNDLQLPDPTVSRRHAHLRYAQGMWFIQDQDSSGGTYINGRRVQAIRLSSGDEITIGNNTFVFRK